MAEDSEKQLIQRSQKGDTEAFGKLYDIHVRTIYNFIYYKTFHKETAEDLTSETFFKALRSIETVDPERSFTSWLYKIAQNSVLDHYRSKRQTEDIDDFWDITSDENSPLEAADIAENVHRLKQHLNKLSAIERDIIIMRVWQDMPYKTIAEVVGKSEASCKMIYSRSLAKLRVFMPLAAFILLIHIIR